MGRTPRTSHGRDLDPRDHPNDLREGDGHDERTATERIGIELDANERHAGHGADKPSEIPAAGWKGIFKRVVTEIKRDHLSLLAAGVAFKGLLAIFPAIVAGISIWGLIASPEQVSQQLSGVLNALPDDAAGIIEDQMTGVAAAGAGELSIALVVSILVALWAASGGMAGLIEGCNAAYNEVDQRKFPAKRGLALLMTLGGILFLLLALGLIAVLPAVLGELGLGDTGELIIRIAQWPLLAALTMVALSAVYKYGPDRESPRTRWATWGAVIATVLWLIGSALFSLYVENLGNFNETYGAFAGIIILMVWLLLTAFVVLLGAEVNAEIERQTGRDTTAGDPRPRGTRGAVAADTTPDDYVAERAREPRSP